jgi:arylsulfatase A-like enzyme
MRKKRKNLLLLSIFLIPGIALLLWPMESSTFEIKVNEKALLEKRDFLNKTPEVPQYDQPNILLITVDDLGMADCSLYGEGEIQTPNLDKLGSEGVIFENAYVTSPVCAPSRAALITGRYQHRFGFEFTMHDRYLRNQLEYFGFRYFIDSEPWVAKWTDEVPDREAIMNQGLPVSEITLAELLKKHGYKTGITGKWHLGWGSDRLPSAFGFDEQYGFFMSHSLYAPEGTPGIVDQKIDEDWTDPYIWGGQRKGPHAIHRNNKVIEEPGYLTDRITDESIDFIDQHREEPFFLWVSYTAPHTPLQAPQEHVDKFKDIEDPVKRVYRAMISSLDDNLGRLMDHLSSQGLDENTLVFLISDNGGAEYTLTTDNGNYQGGKNTEFEGGVKVPMLARWTGVLPEGKRFDHMVSAMDIFTTSAAAANATTMPGMDIDGVNLLPYLSDSITLPPHDYLFWQRGQSKAVRNNTWKLVINDYSGDTLLFNMKDGKYETQNLAPSKPGIVRDLKEAYISWTSVHADPIWPSVIYYTAEVNGKTYYFEQ